MTKFRRSVSLAIPDGVSDLLRLEDFIVKRKPFSFVRFSDGEIEILRNHNLSIMKNFTEYRGRFFKNNFPTFDQKSFHPNSQQFIRRDLLATALFKNEFYFKGVPARHNGMLADREFMLRLHGGADSNITFSDLFMNSNFLMARERFFPSVFSNFEKIAVIGNWRSELKGPLAEALLIKIPDNFFSNYSEVLMDTYFQLKTLPEFSLVLASASSLSNILGYRLHVSRPDLTFIDVGTSLNDLLGLSVVSRRYHQLRNAHGFKEKIKMMNFRFSKGYKLRW